MIKKVAIAISLASFSVVAAYAGSNEVAKSSDNAVGSRISSNAVGNSLDSALTAGQTFSLDLAVNFKKGNKGLNNFKDGNKGFNLYTGGTDGIQIFNLNAGGDLYSINGTDTGLAYDSKSVFHLTFTQTTLAGGTYSVTRGSDTFTGSYTGDADSFHLYNDAGANGHAGAGANFYVNNMSLGAVPEPGTIISFLSGSSLLGAMMFIRRRRV